MEDPNLIATLIPCDNNNLAQTGFRLPHNNGRRYLQLSPGMNQTPNTSSRDRTPPPGTSKASHYLSHCLQLTFSEGPKVPQRGYSFGSSKQSDVLLGESGVCSNLHFCITFDQERNLILKDSSTHGTAVSYGDQRQSEQRIDFTWILNIYKTSRDNPTVKVHDLQFKIEFPDHKNCQSEYNNNVDAFLRTGSADILRLNALGIYTNPKTMIAGRGDRGDRGGRGGRGDSGGGGLPFNPDPIYADFHELGSGTFGEVMLVRNVSTGKYYARKTFKKTQEKEEAWLEKIRNEKTIMDDYPHVSIATLLTKLELIIWKENTVPLKHFREEPEPMLVMPYYPLGNLRDQHGKTSFTRKEIICILFQILKALAYLHPLNVAHRDLKPDNILVESRNDSINIRIGDFGLAKVAEGTKLNTDCGTKPYMAPEIFDDEDYQPSVDLWSAGVIILQYAYGLPSRPITRNWCERISNYANDEARGLDPLIKILQTGMLKMDPKERLSASECLKKVETDLLNNPALDNGEITQTQGTALQVEVADSYGSTIAITGVLQGQKTSNLGRRNHNLPPRSHISKTKSQKTAPQDEDIDDNGSTSTITGVLRGQETSNLEDNGSSRTSEMRLQKTALQDKVTDSNSSTTTVTGVLQGQETSNLENNGSPSHISERQMQKTALRDEITDGSRGRVLEKDDGKSDEKSAGYPISHGGQAYGKKRDKPMGSSFDRDSQPSKRRRKTSRPTSPTRPHS